MLGGEPLAEAAEVLAGIGGRSGPRRYGPALLRISTRTSRSARRTRSGADETACVSDRGPAARVRASSCPTSPPGTRLLLGRSRAADIRFAEPTVSRRHAALQRVDGGWLLVDRALDPRHARQRPPRRHRDPRRRRPRRPRLRAPASSACRHPRPSAMRPSALRPTRAHAVAREVRRDFRCPRLLPARGPRRAAGPCVAQAGADAALTDPFTRRPRASRRWSPARRSTSAPPTVAGAARRGPDAHRRLRLLEPVGHERDLPVAARHRLGLRRHLRRDRHDLHPGRRRRRRRHPRPRRRHQRLGHRRPPTPTRVGPVIAGDPVNTVAPVDLRQHRRRQDARPRRAARGSRRARPTPTSGSATRARASPTSAARSASAYTTVPADVGASLRVTVTATNASPRRPPSPTRSARSPPASRSARRARRSPAPPSAAASLAVNAGSLEPRADVLHLPVAGRQRLGLRRHRRRDQHLLLDPRRRDIGDPLRVVVTRHQRVRLDRRDLRARPPTSPPTRRSTSARRRSPAPPSARSR